MKKIESINVYCIAYDATQLLSLKQAAWCKRRRTRASSGIVKLFSLLDELLPLPGEKEPFAMFFFQKESK